MANSTLTEQAVEFMIAFLAGKNAHSIALTPGDEELYILERALQKQGLLADSIQPDTFVIRNIVNGTQVLLNGFDEPIFASKEFAQACLEHMQAQGHSGIGVFQLIANV